MDNVAKAHADYRQSNWVQLVSNMYDLVENQSKEVENGMGEYQFKPSYQSLEIDSSKWFMMSCEQCKRQLRKVVTMQNMQFEASTPSSIGSNKHKCLLTPHEKQE